MMQTTQTMQPLQTILSPPKHDALKLLALISMVLDHIGYIFEPVLPEMLMVLLRCIGRLAFPIFAYYAAVGAKHTRRRIVYIGRLAVAALLTQPFFALMGDGVNVLVTLGMGVVSIWGYEWLKQSIGPVALIVPCLAAALCELVHTDYGAYGVLFVFCWHWLQYSKEKQFAAFTVLTIAVVSIPQLQTGSAQLLCLSALRVIHSFAQDVGSWRVVHLPRYTFYIFYPVHMGLLWLLYNLMFGVLR